MKEERKIFILLVVESHACHGLLLYLHSNEIIKRSIGGENWTTPYPKNEILLILHY